MAGAADSAAKETISPRKKDSTTAQWSSESSDGPKKDFKLLPVGLLSFDGGGIKGILSTRLMAYSLQYLLSEVDNGQKTSTGDESSETLWQTLMVKYVNAYEPCFDAMWIVWAQQLDSIKIEPQIPGVKKWMDLSWDNKEHKAMIRSYLRIDMAFEFYLAHVLAISGTSTGGIISLGTTLGMSLTQLIATFMDPNLGKHIFQSSFWRLGAGLWQAKHVQTGLEEFVDRLLRWVAPDEADLPHSEKPSRTFVEAARSFNAGIKARILGSGLPPGENKRIAFTLRQAKELYPTLATADTEDWVKEKVSAIESGVAAASEFLQIAKKKRFKVLDGKDNNHRWALTQLRIDKLPSNGDAKEDHSPDTPLERDKIPTYDEEFFATRFLVASRCVNNGRAVVFDSHEPLVKINGKNVMTARGALKFGNDVLDVQTLQVKDVVMATSAAPYFFPAHGVELPGSANMKVFFHDGGVMANDPGLINACINYRHFTKSTGPDKRILPMFRLLRVGCGKSERWEESPVKWYTLQGANIVTSLPDIFMYSDTYRTNLLASILNETYVLQDFKLDSYIPTGPGKSPELSLDDLRIVGMVNGLFAQLHPNLATHIAIPEADLQNAVKNSKPEKDFEHAVIDLKRNLQGASVFLSNTESPKSKGGKVLEGDPAFVDSFF